MYIYYVLFGKFLHLILLHHCIFMALSLTYQCQKSGLISDTDMLTINSKYSSIFWQPCICTLTSWTRKRCRELSEEGKECSCLLLSAINSIIISSNSFSSFSVSLYNTQQKSNIHLIFFSHLFAYYDMILVDLGSTTNIDQKLNF